MVHEAFLRLFKKTEIWWENSAHFLFAISREMRHILTEYARRRLRDKRGGRDLRMCLVGEVQIEDAASPHIEEVISVGEALDELDRLDSRAAKVVELRFFSGLTVEETAAVLQISERTVREVWSFARVWLKDTCRRLRALPDTFEDDPRTVCGELAIKNSALIW